LSAVISVALFQSTTDGTTTINSGNAAGKIFGATYVRLVDRKDRQRSVQQMALPIRERLAAIPGVTVTNVGTSSAAVFNFSIPRGDEGASFDPAAPGAIGGTTAAAGNFTSLSASTILRAPLTRPNAVNLLPGQIYVKDGVAYFRNATGATGMEERLLVASGNLASVTNLEIAFRNLLFGGLGAPVIWSSPFTQAVGTGSVSEINSGLSSGTTPNYGAGLGTGTTSTGFATYFVNPGVVASTTSTRGFHTLQGFKRFYMSGLFMIPTLSDATDTFTAFIGGFNAVAGYSARDFAGAMIQGNRITATAINSGTITSSSSSETYTANTWIKAEISWDGTTLSISINNGTPLAVDSGFGSRPLGYGSVIAKTAGTNNRQLYVGNGLTTFVGWTALP
jgi:hypothetical protein